MDPNTIRVLSLDGGGARGYMQVEFLKKIISHPKVSKIPEEKFWSSFDVIAGTSVGGIIALGLAFGLKLKDIEKIFIDKAKRIFTIRDWWDVITESPNARKDSNRPNKLQMLYIAGCGSYYYKSLNTSSNYGNRFLTKTLIDIFGNATLKDLNNRVLIPAYQLNPEQGVIFSNVDSELYIGQTAKIVDVALATSAAPFYLPPHSFNGNTYIDGGIFQNNPSIFALGLGRTLKNNSGKICSLSLGT